MSFSILTHTNILLQMTPNAFWLEDIHTRAYREREG